jgi:hypothetical protein
MSNWKITWFDGGRLREKTIFNCDFWNLASVASSEGVSTYGILKIERIAE